MPVRNNNLGAMNWGSAALRRFGNPAIILLFVDASVIVLAFYLAIGLRFAFDFQAIERSVGSLPLKMLGFTICELAGLVTMGLYRTRQRPTAAESVVRVVLGAFVGGVLNIFVFYFIPLLGFGRGGMVLGVAIATVLLIAVRATILPLLDENPMKRRVLVIGCGEMAMRIRRLRRRSDRRRFDVIAFVAASDLDRQLASKLDITPVLTPEQALGCERIDEIVVALDDRRGVLPLDFLLQEKQRGVVVTEIVDFLERETERLDLEILRPSWLLYEKSSQTDVVYRWLKRSFDLLFSSALLLAGLPVLMLTAVAIVVEDGVNSPVFYRQRRVGRNGRVFPLLKFRSMRVDAERQTGPQWASSNDARVTRVGRLIRRFRIDELPQLLNVILGDMSVVGPRPERPEFVEDLTRQVPLYFYRHGVRPGLTGWAQLNFPYGASVDDAREKLQYDLYYIKNTNIVTDMLILMQTLEVVVWGRGTSMSGSTALRPAVPHSQEEQAQQELPLRTPPNQDAA